MAKMGEGKYYYYLPHIPDRWEYNDKFYVCKRDSPHPNYTVIASKLTRQSASLIVDALNYMHSSIRVPLDELYKESENGSP
ncbi:hypothetical protein UFOVP1323_50 [uncultured Caudovirales phage]|uniref:Uncharacterized protein n=1 Tax=uncultured Caudovirales phage TaxID=2100421 RepID=A0A6J5RZT6_9CAUD|nr:hypothetical protein UFOVP1323_50 [uncultured Caudovirales phage]